MQNKFIKMIQIKEEGALSSAVVCLIINYNEEIELEKHIILTEKEMDYFQKMKTQVAKNSFLLGRLAAKNCLLQFAGIPFQIAAIEPGIFGFPMVVPNPQNIGITIAHTNNTGIALCHNEKYLFGIDIEILNESNEPIIKSVLTEKEMNIKYSNNISNSFFLHILWVAREALSKSIKSGFLLPMHFFEIENVSLINECFYITFTHFSHMKGIVFQHKQHLIAIAMPYNIELENPNFENN